MSDTSGAALWVKLYHSWATDPKTMQLRAARKYRALHLYVCALTYSAAYALDGWVPAAALPMFGATHTDAASLVDVGYFQVAPDSGDGWWINGYSEWQTTSEDLRELKRRRSEAGRKGGRPPTR